MNNDVARIWTTILKFGLQKDSKQKLMDQLIPENCPLLRTPKLNQEITSYVSVVLIDGGCVKIYTIYTYFALLTILSPQFQSTDLKDE